MFSSFDIDSFTFNNNKYTALKMYLFLYRTKEITYCLAGLYWRVTAEDIHIERRLNHISVHKNGPFENEILVDIYENICFSSWPWVLLFWNDQGK